MNIELYEGQGARLYITLNGEFSVYGGSDEDTFSVSREGNVYKIDVHPHSRGLCSAHRYDIFAKNSDGKEWLVTSGKINVKNRQSTVGSDALSSVEYHLEVELVEGKESETKQMIVGIPGKQGEQGLPGKSAYQYALDNGYVGTEQDFVNMMVGIKLYYEQAEQARQGAVDAQILAETGAINALKSAQDAQAAVDNIEIPELTPEAIQAVVPIAWSEYTAAPVCSGSNIIVIGNAATSDSNTNSLIIGNEASMGWSGTNAVVIGQKAKASAGSNVAIGVESKVSGGYSVGVGFAAISELYSVSVGANSTSKQACIAIGGKAIAQKGIAIGYAAKTEASGYMAIGNATISAAENAITLGKTFTETTSDGNVTHTCTTEGTGSITIGAGANTLNNGDTESSNSVTIGCKASNKGADSVVIGAQAKGATSSVVMGAGASATNLQSVVIGAKSGSVQYGVSLGYEASGLFNNVSVGYKSYSSNRSIAIGSDAKATKLRSTAIGANATVNDYGATVIRSTAEDGTYTQLYFSGANTPLANTYHDGAPMLGYVTKDSAGYIVAAGTRSLIDLLTDNSTFAPASLDENGEWVMPKVFHPSDLDMPQEEPTEPEEYTPLPVYPIVEPEMEEIE